jgi:transcriptional regulator with XRE-family HTH domain
MNIEIANRLVELRKKSGLSQEELADRLGLSRQAISKWERAESSPDTDNLICLAKLYNVSLDEILKTDQSVDEIVEEDKEVSDKEKLFSSNEPVHLNEKDVLDIVSDDSVFYTHNGQKQRVENGCFIYENKTDTVKVTVKKGCYELKKEKRNFWLVFPYPIFITIVYLVICTIMGGMSWGFWWLLFITIPLYYSLVEAILRKNIRHFAFPVFIALIYLTLGMLSTIYHIDIYPNHTGWHPWWVLFILIPVWYGTLDALRIKDPDEKQVIRFSNHD